MSEIEDKLKIISREDPKVITDPNKHELSKISAQVVKSQKSENHSIGPTGLACDVLIEPIPNYIQAECERVIGHDNLNCHIVLGRDRPSDRFSGYGGAASKGSHSIDIVVGRSGANARALDANKEKFWVDNNFQMDAARIHISQRTNIDYNFNIQGRATTRSEEVSGIGIKADCVRVIGRKDVKIVTGTDYYDSKNRVTGVDYKVPHKILLIGDNRDDLIQPMVKGQNLESMLREMNDAMCYIVSAIEAFALNQNKVNQFVMNHKHRSPFWGLATTESPELLIPALVPIEKVVSDVKTSSISIVGLIEKINMKYMLSPDDGTPKSTNILSNYNFCN